MPQYIKIHDVIRAAEEAAGFPRGKLLVSDTTKKTSRVRFAAMMIARAMTNASLQEIANAFCRDDHTTIMSGCKRALCLLETDAGFRSLVGDIETRLSAPRGA